MKTTKNLKIWLAMSMFLLLMVSTATAEIIFVDADAPGPVHDGSSWVTACKYLQDALTDANSIGEPVEIRVADGIYTPDSNSAVPDGTGDRTATFQLKNGVALRGGYAGFGEPDPNERDIDAYETILSGDLAGDDGPALIPDLAECLTGSQVRPKSGCEVFDLDGDNDVDENDLLTFLASNNYDENSYNVVTSSETDETAVLDGFIITGGNANGSWEQGYEAGAGMFNKSGSPTVTNCVFIGNRADWYGGGMYNYSEASPTLTNCTFNGNIAIYGGGMDNKKNSNPTLINCTFSQNSSPVSHGGGMSNIDSSPKLTNCIFSSNTAYTGGGGMHNYTWRDSQTPSRPVLINCSFTANSVEYYGGGGIHNYESSLVLTNCIFSDNMARVSSGGGIYNHGGSSTLTNCIFSGNLAGEMGGGMHNWNQSDVTLTNCIFSGNSADSGGAICSRRECNPILSSCILWGNTATEGNSISLVLYESYTSAVTIGYSDIESGRIGVNVETGCTLTWGEGNIDADPLFVDDGNGDYHLLEDSPCIDAGDPNYIVEPNETDLDGRPRVIGGRIDMGAYEYSPPIPAEVRIVPHTINLTSKGKWITSLFWLPEDYDVADIDPNSVLLEGEIEPEWFSVYEQQQVVIVRFSRSEVQGILNVGEFELSISLQLMDGTVFEGTDVIRVIDKGKKKNQPPNVTITKPQDGAVFGTLETIEIEANAWDVDGSVVKVEFFANGSKIGEDNDGTDGWKNSWNNHPVGSYSLTAKATDNDGATTTSPAVGITVVETPLPGQASNPNPADGATDVSPYANLSWTAGPNAVSHDVYFGMTSPGAFRGNQTATTFDPGTMAGGATYYWRIDEVNAGGTTTGTVWSFTTYDGGGGGGTGGGTIR